MALTNEQTRKVSKYRKVPKPTYYSALEKKTLSISDDFESYLILLSDSLKNEIVQQLKKIKTTNSDRQDRDELLTQALKEELADAQNKYSLLAAELSDFDAFRNKITVEGFTEVVELGTLLTDLQLAYGEDLLSLDRMQHLDVFMTVVQVAFNGGKIDADLLKEIDSFTSLVTTYIGTGGTL